MAESFDAKKVWETIKAPVVLMAVCSIVCALLVFAYNITYVDTTGVITDNLRAACEEVIGEGNYEMFLGTLPEGVNSIITDKENKTCAVEITADGYSKNGLHIVVGFDNSGKVSGISFLSIGETPGLGTKVKNSSFLDQFKGISSADEAQKADTITGATYSSKGMKAAIALAIETYQNSKEEIFK